MSLKGDDPDIISDVPMPESLADLAAGIGDGVGVLGAFNDQLQFIDWIIGGITGGWFQIETEPLPVDKRDTTETVISLGNPNIPVLGPLPGVPAVVPSIADVSSTTILSTPPNEAIMGIVQATDWFHYWELVNAGIAAIEPGAVMSPGIMPPEPDIVMVNGLPVGVNTGVTGLTGNETAGDGGMTFEDFISGVGDLALSALGGAIGINPNTGLPVAAGGGGVIPPNTPVVITQTPGGGIVCHPKRKHRRRRKRLATKSDLSDLAALKGILGGGKAFEVWIATHS